YSKHSILLFIHQIDINESVLAYYIQENVTKQTNHNLDLLSIVLSTFGFGGLLYGFSIAGSSGWGSYHVMISMLIGIISLTWFIRRQLKLPQPLLGFRLFQYSTLT